MEIKPNDYILGMWFAEDMEGNNFLASVKKTTEKWECEYRFRYIKDDNIFDSKDEKSFYRFTVGIEAPEEQVKGAMEMLFKCIKIKYNKFSEAVLVQGNVDKFFKAVEGKPWCNMKKMPLN